MTLADQFDEFLDTTVNLNAHRIALLDERVEAITSFLRGHPTFAELFEDVTPQGSYAHRTIIKPVGNKEYDADVLLLLEEHPTWAPAEYTAELKKAFESSGTYKGKTHKRTRCVCVDYAGDFHVDVVPYVSGRHSITNNKGGFGNEGSWQVAFPEEFTVWLEGKYRLTNDHLPAVLKLLKYLRDYKTTFSVKSVILSILVGNVVNEIRAAAPGYYEDLPRTFVHVLEDLANFVTINPFLPTIPDPAGSGQDFRDRWDAADYENFAKWVKHYAAKARAALEAAPADSTAAWQEIFGAGFKELVVAKARTGALAAADGETLGDHGIVESISATVRLVGRVRRRGVERAFDLPRRGDRVAKDRTIDFEIRDCSVQGDFEVFWKVRNNGDEAAAANCLRGQVVRGDRSRHETTSYWGNHYVDVYIVKDGVCVAKDRQRVIVTRNR